MDRAAAERRQTGRAHHRWVERRIGATSGAIGAVDRTSKGRARHAHSIEHPPLHGTSVRARARPASLRLPRLASILLLFMPSTQEAQWPMTP